MNWAQGIDPQLLAGIREFNAGNFFEAHEHWEALWGETVGEEKRLYQGLVQIAAGYAKLAVSEVNGARKLLMRGADQLAQTGVSRAGLDLAAVLQGVHDDLARLQDVPLGMRGDLSAVVPPRIRFRN